MKRKQGVAEVTSEDDFEEPKAPAPPSRPENPLPLTRHTLDAGAVEPVAAAVGVQYEEERALRAADEALRELGHEATKIEQAQARATKGWSGHVSTQAAVDRGDARWRLNPANKRNTLSVPVAVLEGFFVTTLAGLLAVFIGASFSMIALAAAALIVFGAASWSIFNVVRALHNNR